MHCKSSKTIVHNDFITYFIDILHYSFSLHFYYAFWVIFLSLNTPFYPILTNAIIAYIIFGNQ